MKRIVIPVLFALTAAACSAPRPPQSELQLQQLQTRTYDTSDERLVMRAVLNVLGDRGYVINNTNTELGQITGTKRENASSPMLGILAGTGTLTRVIQCSVYVSPLGNQTRVRAVFEGQLMNGIGAVVKSEHADNAETHGELYQKFFADVDKAIFIQQQKL